MNNLTLPKIKGIYRKSANLSHLTWFKVGGKADILFKPTDSHDLITFLKNLKTEIDVYVIGAGSNLIIRDGGIQGVVIKLGGNSFTNIYISENKKLHVGAGCLNFNIAKFAQAKNISGLEFLIGIPGTAGGGVAMNAGSYGSEYKDVVDSIRVIDRKGNERIITNKEIGFLYRKNSLPHDFIVTEVIFNISYGDGMEILEKMKDISKKREQTQPVKELTSGSTFANPENHNAWKLIDQCGLRGHKIGGAYISEKHCNFMINNGSAIAKDMEDLGEFVKDKVFNQTGIELEWEIKRIGKK